MEQQEAANREKEKYRDEHIQEFYPDDLAIAPVGAYLATYDKGDCWIIVCKWEYTSEGENSPETTLGHVMIWAMDAASQKVLAFVSCD